VGRASGWVALAGAACMTLACGRSRGEEGRERLDELAQEGRELEGAFDRLEERLLVDRAQVDLWQELKVRHQHVSALATTNADDHIAAIIDQLERHGARNCGLNSFALAAGRNGKPRSAVQK